MIMTKWKLANIKQVPLLTPHARESQKATKEPAPLPAREGDRDDVHTIPVLPCPK
jgi:hypothetical protein